jgi:hypothetical protein
MSGRDATLAGTIANGLDCTPDSLANPRHVLVERRQTLANRVTASKYGKLRLFVGTDSGTRVSTSFTTRVDDAHAWIKTDKRRFDERRSPHAFLPPFLRSQPAPLD